MSEKIILYHGSKNIIEKPIFHGGKETNDYGYGFYCTENIELANEWACPDDNDGYTNEYELDLSDLQVLDRSFIAIQNAEGIDSQRRTGTKLYFRPFFCRYEQHRCHKRLPRRRLVFFLCKRFRAKFHHRFTTFPSNGAR